MFTFRAKRKQRLREWVKVYNIIKKQHKTSSSQLKYDSVVMTTERQVIYSNHNNQEVECHQIINLNQVAGHILSIDSQSQPLNRNIPLKLKGIV